MNRWQRRVRHVVQEAGLIGAEADFVAAVDRELTGVPRGPRRACIVETSEALSGRPPADDPTELSAAFGEPSAFAAEWKAAEGLEGWIPPWRHFQNQSRRAQAAQLVAVVAVAATVVALRSYYSAVPELRNSCTGVAATEFEDLQAAGRTERRISHRPGERFGVSLCPWSMDGGVTFDQVFLNGGGGDQFQQVGWEVELSNRGIEWTGDASRHRSWGSDEPVGGWANVMVWFEMDHCLQEGASLGFDTLQVDYRYRGRARTATIPLVMTISVVGGPGCETEQLEQLDARRQAGNDVINRLLYPRPRAIRDLGDYRVTPNVVSADLCRYLRGIEPIRAADGTARYDDFEPLHSRAVFQIADREVAVAVIEAAVTGRCPEFADQRDELVAMVGERG